MDDLIAFVNARLDEEEAEVKGPPGWKLEHWTTVKYADKESGRNWRVDAEPRCVVDAVAMEDAQFIARHDPARALREVTAKRAILAEHRPVTGITSFPLCGRCGRDDHMEPFPYQWPCVTVRAVAAVYSDHPDYRAEWA
jgi:hypothetical protein